MKEFYTRDKIVSSLRMLRFHDYRILGDVADIAIADGQDGSLNVICDVKSDIGPGIEILEHRMKQCVLENFQIVVNVIISGNVKDLPSNNDITSNLSGMFTRIPDVKNTILVCSGKGGVGKSTIAAKLAVALSIIGKNVGIVDLDIYGPSIPDIFSVYDVDVSRLGNGSIPICVNNIQIMSMGFMMNRDQPAIWRGPILTKVIQKLIRQTEWSNLDYLIIDTPPGTGDVHISLMQKFPIDGGILVSTPHKISLQNTSKTANMLKKFGIPIIGLVQNMINTSANSDMSIMDKVEVVASIPLNNDLSDINDHNIYNHCRENEQFNTFARLVELKAF